MFDRVFLIVADLSSSIPLCVLIIHNHIIIFRSRAEISILERKRDRNDEKAGLDAIETKKLERLQKELRIVSAECAKRRALAEEAQIERERELLAAQKTVAGVQKLNESKYSLVERFASVYYDEKMNPFGAPAPGQPKLYFADAQGTTTTMDSRRAVVPGKLASKIDLIRGVKDEKIVARKSMGDDPGDAVNQQHMTTMHPPLVAAGAPQHVHSSHWPSFTHPPHHLSPYMVSLICSSPTIVVALVHVLTKSLSLFFLSYSHNCRSAITSLFLNRRHHQQW